MATRSKVAPLIVIVGPTASGKTSLAIDLAERYNGEIICADSRTIYKGLDIGTAKPTHEERRRVVHHGLDLVAPGEPYSAAQFQRYAKECIKDIRSRGKTPFLVGGTGLYIDAILFNFTFGAVGDEEVRHFLEQKSISELHDYCYKNNIMLPENCKNKRYVIRAIERSESDYKRQTSLIDNVYVVGIATSMNNLRTRIERRAEHIFSKDVVKETTDIAARYGWDSEAMTGNIYPLIHEYLQGAIDQHELQRRFAVSDYRLAKRQMTWLRRNPYILWASLASAEHYLSTRLENL